MGREDCDEAGRLVARVEAIVASGGALQEMLDGVVAELHRADLRGAGIGLIDQNNELFVGAFAGHMDEEVRDARLPVGQGIMGRVASTGEPALIDDLDSGRANPANRNVGTNAAIRSLVCVPIRLDGTVIGVLEVDSSAPGRFDRHDVELLTRVGRALVPALREAGPLRLANDQLRRRVRELSTMQAVTVALGGSLDLPTVIDAALTGAARALAAPAALLLRRERAGVVMVASHVRGISGTGTGMTLRRGTLPELESVLASGEAVAFPSVLGHAALARETGLATIGSCVAAPLVVAGTEADSLLVVATDTAHHFDPDEARLLHGIAGVAALAISNAERHRALAHAMATDSLTGLANASAFERALAQPHPAGLAVIAIDVDRLREINDQGGYEAGDEALRRIAEALDKTAAGAGLLARTGGDEFALLLPGADENSAAEMGALLRRTLDGMVLPAGLCRVTMGIAAGGPAAPGDARMVWWWASEAMDSNKGWGRDRVAGSGSSPVTMENRHQRWAEVIARTLAEHSVTAVFQPVVTLSGRGTVGYEALARPHGHTAAESVEKLFEVAQRVGASRDLDWLCRRAALDGSRGVADGLDLFVNIGVWSLLDPVHDVDQMLLLCDWGGRDPQTVVLEITERELISDMCRLESVLATYRAEGFRFAIDDVGEGHSTFEVLAAAAPEFIKVARSLTVGRDRLGARSAIHAVVAFARSSGATVIAEGIESDSDAEMALELGIELGQGWLLGRPGALPLPAAPPRPRVLCEPPAPRLREATG